MLFLRPFTRHYHASSDVDNDVYSARFTRKSLLVFINFHWYYSHQEMTEDSQMGMPARKLELEVPLVAHDRGGAAGCDGKGL